MKRYNYNKLKGRIRECFPKQSDFARKLDISAVSLSYKLNNKIPFDQDEIMDSIDLFKLTPEEAMSFFFTKEVDKTSTRN